MAIIYIEHNPRNLQSIIKYEGTSISPASILYKYLDKKLDIWIDQLLPAIENELYDKKYVIMFRGSYHEFMILDQSMKNAKNTSNVNCFFLTNPALINYENLKVLDNEATNDYNLQNCYGIAYHYGLGVKNDCLKAKQLYEFSIQQGSFDAQYNLGLLFFTGEDCIPQNYVQSIRLFSSAAQHEHPQAQYCLSEIYRNGLGVEKNSKIAFEWCLKSAINGYSEAQYQVAKMFYCGVGTTKDDSQAFDWYKKAANQSHALANFALAEMYFNGVGVAKSLENAFDLYKKASLQGIADAQYKLALMYFGAMTTDKNDVLAAEWYQQAANQGHLKAKYNLAYLLLNGFGLAEDERKAFEIYQSLAESDLVEAQYNLALLYLEGIGAEQNFAEAMRWFQRSADAGYADSILMMGNIYYEGLGVKPDMDQAMKYYRLAVEKGQESAKVKLEQILTNQESHHPAPLDGGVLEKNKVLPTKTYLSDNTIEEDYEILTYSQCQLDKLFKSCERLNLLTLENLTNYNECMKKEHQKIDKALVLLEVIDSPDYKYKVSQFFLDDRGHILYADSKKKRAYGKISFAFALNYELNGKMGNKKRLKLIFDVKGG